MDLSSLLDDLARRMQPKVKSLIITIYGDAIAHRGGNAWLGNVIALAALAGVQERAVRTAVFRLAQEGWLASQQIGRRSYYRLTDDGRRRFDAVHQRLYHAPLRAWDHGWTVLALRSERLDAQARTQLERDLSWQGFGAHPCGVWLHPGPDDYLLEQMLAPALRVGAVLVVRGPALPMISAPVLRDTAQECWRLEQLAGDYQAFLALFRPVWQTLRGPAPLDGAQAFAVRTLLMHGYRRACLRDPFLPAELLPADWPGTPARALCRNLYLRVQAAAEMHVAQLLETPEGPSMPPQASYYARFGGLEVPVV
jgi:phenylacetic acid degradation operon negative regulatory protein